jgi:hypothetical protein
MEKGKTGVWTAIFSAELDLAGTRWAAPVSIGGSSPPRRLRLRRSVLTANRRPFVAQAALLAALVAAGSTAALAEKGGRGHHQGIPNVNLGLGQFRSAGAGVGPFVPSALPGAAGLTSSHGLLPPGRLDMPGLHLGRGHSAGSPPGYMGTPGVLPPQSAVGLSQPDNGLAPGESDDELRPGTADLPMVQEAAAARIVSAMDASANEQTGSGESRARRLPTCR